MASILLVGLPRDLQGAVSRALVSHGHTVAAVGDVAAALRSAGQSAPALTIANADLPGFDGLYLCQAMRAAPNGADSSVIFLSNAQSLADKLSGFAAGADDYITTPLQMAQLMLRVQALLRRVGSLTEEAPENSPYPRHNTITLNPQTGEVWLSGHSVTLTPVETRLLAYLVASAGRPASAEELLCQVWEQLPGAGDPTLVRVHMRHLRAKLEANPAAPQLLKTVPGLGYCFKQDGAS